MMVIDIVINIINAGAAICFLVGSILSMVINDKYIYGWFYIFGSGLFLVPSVINLVRLYLGRSD